MIYNRSTFATLHIIRGFECRGVDITGWDKCSEESGSGVTVVSKAGTVFEDVHLDEDWYEYCEKGRPMYTDVVIFYSKSSTLE